MGVLQYEVMGAWFVHWSLYGTGRAVVENTIPLELLQVFKVLLQLLNAAVELEQICVLFAGSTLVALATKLVSQSSIRAQYPFSDPCVIDKPGLRGLLHNC